MRQREFLWETFNTPELFGQTLGVIGFGRIGTRVAEYATALGCRVIAYTPNPSPVRAAGLKVAFVDLETLAYLRPDVLDTAAKHFGITNTYTDFREMLSKEQLDGVTIAVWHPAHFEVARTCLENGLHMVLEKPMVLKARHAKELIDLARDKNLEIIMSYPWNFIPQSVRVRELIKSGMLDRIHYISDAFLSEPLYLYRGDDYSDEVQGMYPVIGPAMCTAIRCALAAARATCRSRIRPRSCSSSQI